MEVRKPVWDQLKGKTCQEIIAALQRDGFSNEGRRGAVQAFRHPDGRRAVVHYHPKKTYGTRLLKQLIEDIGWSEPDMRRLRLIK